MIDRDKVIRALEYLISEDCTDNQFDYADEIETAIALLKEQEPVPVPEDKINKCECGKTVCRYWHPKFCGFCGRELLWY